MRFRTAGQGGRACALAVGAGLALVGCSTPLERADQIASRAGLTRSVVHGLGYDHVVYVSGRPVSGQVVHVYIEGDGTPYLHRWSVSPDPTPRRPLMLTLMAMDPGPAVYVGRPCYFGLAAVAPCTAYDWTLRRFSKPILDSMASAVSTATAGATALELYGHSGGGTVAVLLARRLPNVTRVVTLAGNLDPQAWIALHGYTPLTELEDPLVDGPLPATVRQLHAVGSKDRNVPPALVTESARRLGADDVRILPGVDHAHGWSASWPALRDGIVTAAGGV